MPVTPITPNVTTVTIPTTVPPGYTFTTGLITSNSAGIWPTSNSPYDCFITTSEHKKLQDRVEEIEKRLAILQPNETLQEKYPALQEAYDAYKIIEKLVK